MEKATVSQDFLYSYIQEHNINRSTIAALMGMDRSGINSCFNHHLDKYGKPRYFSATAIVKLNAALSQMADEMRQSMITFGSPETYTNRGGTFDPACMPAVRALSRFFNLTAMTRRVLGWTETKKNTVLSAPSSKIYGHVTQDDVNRLNAELLAVAGTLSGMEVELDERSTSCSSSSDSE